MGDLLSKPSTNPSESNQSIDMSSSEPSQTLESKLDEGKPIPKSPETQAPVHDSGQPAVEEKGTLEESQGKVSLEKDQEGEDEEEEEGECGFCLFMKGGGCRDSFIGWEDCIQEAKNNKEDIVEKCFEVTVMMKKCMEAHSDYYGPLLQAEKKAEEEAIKELEREKGKEATASSSGQSEQNSVEKVSE